MRAIAALTVLLVLGCAGCGLQAGTPGAPKASPSASPSASATRTAPVVSCVHLKPAPGRVPGAHGQRTVSLTNADNHGSFCVPRGTGIFVFLHETTLLPWAPIQSSSAVLQRRPSGVLSLIRGETGSFFVAAAAGTANLTSFEPRCFNGPHPGVHRDRPGGHCPKPLKFAVVVHVLP